jgi:hypothetical protein
LPACSALHSFVTRTSPGGNGHHRINIAARACAATVAPAVHSVSVTMRDLQCMQLRHDPCCHDSLPACMRTDAGMGGFAGLGRLLSFASSDDPYGCEPVELQLHITRALRVRRSRPLQRVVVTGRHVFSPQPISGVQEEDWQGNRPTLKCTGCGPRWLADLAVCFLLSRAKPPLIVTFWHSSMHRPATHHSRSCKQQGHSDRTVPGVPKPVSRCGAADSRRSGCRGAAVPDDLPDPFACFWPGLVAPIGLSRPLRRSTDRFAACFADCM